MTTVNVKIHRKSGKKYIVFSLPENVNFKFDEELITGLENKNSSNQQASNAEENVLEPELERKPLIQQQLNGEVVKIVSKQEMDIKPLMQRQLTGRIAKRSLIRPIGIAHKHFPGIKMELFYKEFRLLMNMFKKNNHLKSHKVLIMTTNQLADLNTQFISMINAFKTIMWGLHDLGYSYRVHLEAPGNEFLSILNQLRKVIDLFRAPVGEAQYPKADLYDIASRYNKIVKYLETIKRKKPDNIKKAVLFEEMCSGIEKFMNDLLNC